MDEISPKLITLQDPFWSPRVEINASRAIFHQWEQLEASGCIHNFRIAAGEAAGWREGWFFADSDAYKWLDAASRICAARPDPRLAGLVDDFIALLGRAQMPDGYLFTYNQIHFPGVRWVNLQIEHELYCHGHLIEAGVSHHAATGRSDLLLIARRAADRVAADFAGRGPAFTPGHEEIEIALLRLFGVTHHAPYLDLARQFLEQRGRQHGFAASLARQMRSAGSRSRAVAAGRRAYVAAHGDRATYTVPPGNRTKRPRSSHLRWLASALSGKYFQQHAPIRRQTAPVGHAVRFGYLQAATAMLCRTANDDTLLPGLVTRWERMVTRRMYVTGGLGALPGLEGFGRDDELDPEVAYAETCAALASMLWNWQMSLITAEARYSDLLEWQMYNAAAVGMGLGGDTYFYNNPLACRKDTPIVRRAWYAVPCCPSNLSRTWADLGKTIYTVSGDNVDVYIHQWIGNRAHVDPGVPVEIGIASGLPWSGEVAVRVTPEQAAQIAIHLRVPSWVDEAEVRVNGEAVVVPAAVHPAPPPASGFDPRLARWLTLRRRWTAGDTISLRFDLPIHARKAGPRVAGHAGKVALTRGPLVYCLESIDNPGIDIFAAAIDLRSLRPEPAPDLLGGVVVLRGRTADGRPVTAIPYALWGNRGASEMTVWVAGQ